MRALAVCALAVLAGCEPVLVSIGDASRNDAGPPAEVVRDLGEPCPFSCFGRHACVGDTFASCDSHLCVSLGTGGVCTMLCDDAACPDGYECQPVDGYTVCVPLPCEARETRCMDGCVDLQADAENCGECGNECGIYSRCTDGECVVSDCTVDGCRDDSLECDPVSRRCMSTCMSDAQCITPNSECNTAAGRCECWEHYGPCSNGLCSDLGSDPNNCGACGRVCGYGLRCSAGECACPDFGQTLCGSRETDCVDTRVSYFHCGECGHACNGAQQCVWGTCQCALPGQTACGDDCPILESDSEHCGECDHRCPGLAQCEAGECLPGLELVAETIPTTRSAEAVAIAVTDDDVVHVLDLTYFTGDVVEHTRTPSGWTSSTAPVALPGAPWATSSLRVVAAGTTLFIAYRDGESHVRYGERSADGVWTFETASTETDTANNGLALAVDGTTPYVAVTRDSIVRIVRRESAGTWVEREGPAADRVAGVGLAVSSGRIELAFTESSVLRFATSEAGGPFTIESTDKYLAGWAFSPMSIGHVNGEPLACTGLAGDSPRVYTRADGAWTALQETGTGDRYAAACEGIAAGGRGPARWATSTDVAGPATFLVDVVDDRIVRSVVPFGYAYDLAMAVDSHGNPHVVGWVNATSSLQYARRAP